MVVNDWAQARMVVRLAVAGAFHTDFMLPAVAKLEKALAETTLLKVLLRPRGHALLFDSIDSRSAPFQASKGRGKWVPVPKVYTRKVVSHWMRSTASN